MKQLDCNALYDKLRAQGYLTSDQVCEVIGLIETELKSTLPEVDPHEAEEVAQKSNFRYGYAVAWRLGAEWYRKGLLGV